MKIRNIISSLIFLVAGMLNVGLDFEEYECLENRNAPLIKKEDLPNEFSDEAYNIIVDFFEKTWNLDYEWALFFDYDSGDILKCVKGSDDNVIIDFKDDEFDGYNVASIHNHPKNVFSPPSHKNFGILTRKFEDFELIVGCNELWILKAKGNYENLIFEFKFISRLLFKAALDNSNLLYDDWDEINNHCEKSYGNQLLKYINDKNIKDIQLTKREYSTMTNQPNNLQAEYNCLKKIYDPEEFKKSDARNANPNIVSGKDAVYALYQLMGMEIEYDEIFAE